MLPILASASGAKISKCRHQTEQICDSAVQPIQYSTIKYNTSAIVASGAKISSADSTNLQFHCLLLFNQYNQNANKSTDFSIKPN